MLGVDLAAVPVVEMRGGEAHGRRRMEHFTQTGLPGYATARHDAGTGEAHRSS